MYRGLLLLLSLSSNVWASDYFVDVTLGNDARGEGSRTAPFRTIRRAARSNLYPGDVVHVAAGAYNEQVMIKASGAPSAPVTFICDERQQCKVIGQSYAAPHVYGRAAFLLLGSFIEVNGFDVSTDRSGTQGIVGYGTAGGYRIISNRVHDIPVVLCDRNGGTGINPEGSDGGGHSYVAQNVVTKVGFASSCGKANGIYLAGNGSVAVNNLIFNSWGSGIDVAHAATNVVVAFNTVDNIKSGNGIGGDGVYLGCDTANCDHNTVANNILTNNANAGIESYQGSARIPASHNVLSNNLMYHNRAPCLFPAASGRSNARCEAIVNANPMFIGRSHGDFHLSPCSPAISGATPQGVPTSDLDGNPRPDPRRGKHDIGAYTFIGADCKLAH